jgi:hypothetical protein
MASVGPRRLRAHPFQAIWGKGNVPTENRAVTIEVSLSAGQLDALADRLAELIEEGRDDGFVGVEGPPSFSRARDGSLPAGHP